MRVDRKGGKESRARTNGRVDKRKKRRRRRRKRRKGRDRMGGREGEGNKGEKKEREETELREKMGSKKDGSSPLDREKRCGKIAMEGQKEDTFVGCYNGVQ